MGQMGFQPNGNSYVMHSFRFLFIYLFFSMDGLELTDMALTLGAIMNVDMSNVTHVANSYLLILTVKMTDGPI
jgi:hypothetical protein